MTREGDWGTGRGAPVPRRFRNPRRAYDAEGREIEPATLANAKAGGAVCILAWCDRCGHQGEMPFGDWPDSTYVPDIGARLRCTGCGARGAWIRTRTEGPRRDRV